MAEEQTEAVAAPEVQHPTRDERRALGKAARSKVPRPRHAELALDGRIDPISLLEEQARTRVAELVPVRHGRMMTSPFAFFRGGALIMAADLSRTPVSGLETQLCGDAHLQNFGLFGTPERNLAFDINDFDETSPGPWEWDLKRLVASVEIVGRETGFSRSQRRDAVLATASSYREAMLDMATLSNLEVWYARMDAASLMETYGKFLSRSELKTGEKAIAKAYGRNSAHAFEKLTEIKDGVRQMVSSPPLVVALRDLLQEHEHELFSDAIDKLLHGYHQSLPNDKRVLIEQFRPVDLARKVVGVGSVGTRCWIGLLLGYDEDDPLILQIKEAQPSVLEAFVGRRPFAHQGERVVRGQRLMQAASDILLGWTSSSEIDGQRRDFYIRQLYDWKGSFEATEAEPSGTAVYGRMCGRALARAHARVGDRIAIAAYLGKGGAFDTAMATFASAYADQNERDYQTFIDAISNGRIAAEAGV